jgi:hypothetical protein
VGLLDFGLFGSGFSGYVWLGTCCNELLLGLRAGIYRCLLGFGCLKAMVVLGTN